MFKAKYEAKLEFPLELEVSKQKPCKRQMGIFWNNTISFFS